MMKFIFGFILSLTVSGWSASDATVPVHQGAVNDFANVLSPGTKDYLERLATALEQPTGFALVFLILPSLPENTTLEEYAVLVYEQWGIGKKGKDAGALILAAIGDRQVRIEVGYGAEGFLPDAICKRIIEQSMTPQFRKGDFDAGFLAAALEITRRAAAEYRIDPSALSLDKPPRPVSTDTPIKIGPFQLLIIIVLLFLILGTRPGRSMLTLLILSNLLGNRNSFGSGGFGGGFSSRGGFGGFGGGISGGGGASGRW